MNKGRNIFFIYKRKAKNNGYRNKRKDKEYNKFNAL
jgi:hypothetical protein